MAYRTVLVCFLVAVITSAEQVVEEEDLRDIVNRQKDMLIQYDRNLDQVVPFKELRASLEALDALAQDYNGKCRGDIYKATTLGYHATDNYYRATDKIFKWCAFTKQLTTYILDNEPSKPRVVKVILAITKEGNTLVNESIALLEQVRTQLTDMQTIFRPIPTDLRNEINQIRADYEERKNNVSFFEKIWRAIKKAVKIVLKFVKGVVGDVLGLLRKLGYKNIPDLVIEGNVEPDEDQNMEIMETYYTALINAVNDASGNVTAVKKKLVVEINKVTELHAKIGATKVIGEVIGEYLRSDLKLLQNSVTDYIDRHRGREVPEPRNTREITFQDFNVDRIKRAVYLSLNRTAKEREERFWELKTNFPNQPYIYQQNQPYIYQTHSNDFGNFAV